MLFGSLDRPCPRCGGTVARRMDAVRGVACSALSCATDGRMGVRASFHACRRYSKALAMRTGNGQMIQSTPLYEALTALVAHPGASALSRGYALWFGFGLWWRSGT